MSRNKIILVTMFISLGVFLLFGIFGLGIFIGKTNTKIVKTSLDENITLTKVTDVPTETTSDEQKEPDSNPGKAPSNDDIGELPSASTPKTQDSTSPSSSEVPKTENSTTNIPPEIPENQVSTAPPQTESSQVQAETTVTAPVEPNITSLVAAKKYAAFKYEPFDILDEEEQYMLIYDNKSRELVKLETKADIKKVIDAYKTLNISEASTTSDRGTNFSGASEMRLSTDEKTVYTYVFYTKGIEVLTDASSEFYPCTEKSMTTFKTSIQTVFDSKGVSPTWLGIMSPQKYDSMQLYAVVNGRSKLHDSLIYDHSIELFKQLKDIHVVKGTMSTVDTLPNSAPYKLELTFNSGVIYDIVINEENIYIASSDMDGILKYNLLRDLNYEKVICTINTILGIDDEDVLKNNPLTAKPLIYLYPKTEQEVTVKLDFAGDLTFTYPEYHALGWRVKASPNGTLTDLSDNSAHYYLFWEGTASKPWTYDKGSVVAGKDTKKFLMDTLKQMGLNAREYNDFLTYWLPQMEVNEYNFISFSGKEYDDIAKLTIDPKPDSILRVHMLWKSITSSDIIDYKKIEAQSFETFKRSGFSVVEWGGTKLR